MPVLKRFSLPAHGAIEFLSGHYDSVFSLAAGGAAVALAAAGQAPAAIFLAAVVSVQTCVNLATKYVAAT
jgi:hypothetical protein